MIAKTYIVKNLTFLENKYQKAKTTKESLFFSKLALMELCGWIEETMDDIVLRCGKRHIKKEGNLKFLEKQIVKNTYGFEYDRHFRKMLINLIGLINVERLEKKVDTVAIAKLKGSLSSLIVMRNAEAHTHIKGTTRTIDSPSVTLHNFNKIFNGLKEFETTLKATGY